MNRQLKVPPITFDGQWYALMVRDEEGKPLTKLQVQMDVWKEVTKMKKNEIVDRLRNINIVSIQEQSYTGFTVEKSSSGLILSSTDNGFQTITTATNKKFWMTKNCAKGQKEKPQEEEETNVSLDWIPEDVMKVVEQSGDNDLLSTIQDISRGISNILARDDRKIDDNENEDTLSKTNNTENETEKELFLAHMHNKEEITYELQAEHFASILSALKQSKRKEKWTNTTVTHLEDTMKDGVKMSSFSKEELDKVVSLLKDEFGFSQIPYKKSWTKGKIINNLCKMLGKYSQVQEKRKRTNHRVPMLKELVVKTLKGKTIPKTILNIAYAQHLFPDALQKWQQDNPFGAKSFIKDLDIEVEWYSQPEKNRVTGEPLCKCLDSHHLLTNLRIKTSTTGLENISQLAWKRVVKSYKTDSTPAMVDDLVDKQCNAYAQTHFSEGA